MEEKDNLTKAMTLMSSALKEYEDGRFGVAEHSRKEANKLFDSVMEEMSTQDGVDKMRFGESRNFGMLYSIFEANSMELFANDREKLMKIVEAIQTNPVLFSEFKTYNAFLNPVGVNNSDFYVNEAVQLAERHTLSELKKANTEFLSKIREIGLNENVCPSPSEIALFEDIEYVITNKPDITNIVGYSDVKHRLSECVSERNITKKQVNSTEMKDKIDEAYDTLLEKYSSELTNDEIELLESMSNDDKDNEKRFNTLKEGLIKRIDKELLKANEIDKQKWISLKENIQSKSYEKKSALVDMAEMIEACEIIDE